MFLLAFWDLTVHNVQFVFKWIHCIRVDGRKRCENATSGRDFFENGEKKLRFQKNTDTWGQGLKPMKRIH